MVSFAQFNGQMSDGAEMFNFKGTPATLIEEKEAMSTRLICKHGASAAAITITPFGVIIHIDNHPKNENAKSSGDFEVGTYVSA